jgi:sulfopyruvate decarboxylase TPP-binding subunit
MQGESMDAEPARLIIEALKEEKIDLFVTLPEEPTASLTQAVQADPYFQCVPVASEDGGVALTAGAVIAGRRAVFVTGIAGLLKGGLALMHMGPQYGIPVFILASYRGDFGDRSGISGSKLQVFRQVGEPFLQALRIPYQIVGERRTLKRTIRDAHFMCRTSDMPAALLLTGEVLW